ncbi:MAG: glycogen debranching enzyme family protein, partial [Myxococcales bacterium]|nr:glycogen debranching enzyme family protein [Myxococcales bacterium]
QRVTEEKTVAKKKRELQPPEGSPWPYVEVQGDLGRAEMEWLHTNDAGAYSMSTVALSHTRRYHGLLVAALAPPLARHVILSHAETEVEIGQRSHRLAAHRFPGVAPMPGYRQLTEFAQTPIPHWRYKLGKATFDRRLALVRGKNALVLSFSLSGVRSATLKVRPLLSLRPMHELTHEHGGMLQTVALRPRQVQIQPRLDLPQIHFEHHGLFVGSPDWWRRFEYSSDDQGEATEDLWTPGVFEMQIEDGQTLYLTVSVGEPLEGDPAEFMRETEEYLLAQDPGEERPDAVRKLFLAADQFCAENCQRPAVISGYPWFGVWTRDTCIALPGLYLTRGKVDEAKAVLRTLLGSQQSGLLPRRLAEQPSTVQMPSLRPIPAGFGRSEFSSVDSTLWLFEAARALLAWTGSDDPFVKDELYPSLAAAFDAVCEGRAALGVELTEDALLKSMAPKSTSDDPSPAHSEWGKRKSLPIELQALWTRGARVLAGLAADYGDRALEQRALEMRARATQSFKARFWCEHQRYPYDSLSLDASQPGDDRIRAHALLALAVDPDLFDTWQANSIVERVTAELLTPRGIRSLSPSAVDYLGQFDGSFEEREAAYHRGATLTYLLGFYARAVLRLRPDDFEVQSELQRIVEQALDEPLVLGQISQLANGDPPHRATGAPAQAASVASLLWILCAELEL